MLLGANRFHLLVCLGWQFSLCVAIQLILPLFYIYVPEWQCENGPISRSCEEYDRCGGNVTFVDVYFQSTAMEFNWICGSQTYMRSLLPQIQLFGTLLGTLLMGPLSDAFGRRPISLLTLFIGILFSIITAFVPNWKLLLFIRFFVGASGGGIMVCVQTYVMELLLPNQRLGVRAFFNWGTARLIMTLICMAIASWRPATIACAIVGLPALTIVFFVFPESPTWLHNKGRLEEMRVSEKWMARVAGIDYKPIEHRPIPHTKSFLELLRTPGLLRRLLVLWCMLFVVAVCGYATDLNSSSITGNLFVNQILFSILISASKMVLVTIDTNFAGFTRRTLHQGAQTVICVCFLVLTVLSLSEYRGVLLLIINLMGTVFIEYTWDACYLCAIESIETPCRASATATGSIISRVAGIIAPLLNYFSTLWAPSVYLAVFLLGTVNLFVSYFFLVETKNVNLDDVVMSEEASEETPMTKEVE